MKLYGKKKKIVEKGYCGKGWIRKYSVNQKFIIGGLDIVKGIRFYYFGSMNWNKKFGIIIFILVNLGY